MPTTEPGLNSAIVASARNLQAKLPPSERAAADTLLTETDAVVAMSIGHYAERAGVSKSSVLRFCTTLGFRSYKAFKVALARELGQAAVGPLEAIGTQDTPGEIFRKVVRADVRALEETLELIREAQLAQAVDILADARKIEVYGVGLSASVALDAYSRFVRIGLNVSAITDAHMQAISASLLTPQDVVFAVSHSGRSLETLRAARYAQEAGAIVICLSSFLKSPLVELAKVALVAATGETAFRVDAMASRIAHLSVVDTLYVALANRRAEHSRALLRRTGEVMAELTQGEKR